MYRLSRILPKEQDPLCGSKTDIIITIFSFFQRNCSVLGVHEKRKEVEGKGEGGRGEEEEEHVFLTFRMVTGRATFGADRTSAGKATCAQHGQISFVTVLQKGTFSYEKATFFTK